MRGADNRGYTLASLNAGIRCFAARFDFGLSDLSKNQVEIGESLLLNGIESSKMK